MLNEASQMNIPLFLRNKTQFIRNKNICWSHCTMISVEPNPCKMTEFTISDISPGRYLFISPIYCSPNRLDMYGYLIVNSIHN